jgi:cation transport ATPase
MVCCNSSCIARPFVQITHSLRNGNFGLDIIASLSMTMALAFQQNLAANVLALMFSGGQFLEEFAA